MDNFRVAENIDFFETTHTNNAGLLGKNRTEGLLALPKIVLTANVLAQPIRKYVLGNTPIEIHSFFRGWSLNGQTKGSSSTSQHPKGEAFDWSRWGAETRDECYHDFEMTRDFLVEKRIVFGQLIFEECDRGYSKAHWIHTSMGAPFRDLHRCGQILTMKDGKFTMIEKIDFSWWKL